MDKLATLSGLTKKQQWYADHLDKAAQLGLSISTYAREQNIKLKNIYNAHSTLRKRQQAQFSEAPSPFIQAGSVALSSPGKARVMLGNGCAIDVSLRDISLAELLQSVSRL